MPGSLIDMLPPEAQNLLGVMALGAGLLGLVLWGAGVKVARVSVAILFGVGVAALGAWALPKFLGMTVASGSLAGFAVGVLAGAVGFRVLQGLTLAACLGLAVAGGYYWWHVDKTPPPPAATESQAGVKASDLLIKGRLTETPATSPAPPNDLATFTQKLAARWNSVPATDQHRMLAAGIGTAAIVLLLAFGFARQTTLVVSAVLGTLMLMAGVQAASHLYAPAVERFFLGPAAWRYATLGIAAALGMLTQWWFFWPPKRPKAAINREKDEGKSAMGRANI